MEELLKEVEQLRRENAELKEEKQKVRPSGINYHSDIQIIKKRYENPGVVGSIPTGATI